MAYAIGAVTGYVMMALEVPPWVSTVFMVLMGAGMVLIRTLLHGILTGT